MLVKLDFEEEDPILFLYHLLRKIIKMSVFRVNQKLILTKLHTLIDDISTYSDYDPPGVIHFQRRQDSTNFEFICELTRSYLDQCKIGEGYRLDLDSILATQ